MWFEVFVWKQEQKEQKQCLSLGIVYDSEHIEYDSVYLYLLYECRMDDKYVLVF